MKHVLITGRVQGVGFRYNALRKAEDLGLKGFVRNLEDVRVEAVVDGPEEKVEEFLTFCREGPVFAKVQEIKVTEKDLEEEFSGFEIRH